jgi:hypothetical protein
MLHKGVMYKFGQDNIFCRNPTLKECEDATHTPEMGTWESFGTPETSEFDCRGQNTSHWGIFYIIGSQRELQLCFRPCPNRRYEQRVIVSQSCGSPNRGSFKTPLWESRDKKPLGCGCRGEAQRILYGGR